MQRDYTPKQLRERRERRDLIHALLVIGFIALFLLWFLSGDPTHQ